MNTQLIYTLYHYKCSHKGTQNRYNWHIRNMFNVIQHHYENNEIYFIDFCLKRYYNQYLADITAKYSR